MNFRYNLSIFAFLACGHLNASFAMGAEVKIWMDDVHHFWEAMDSLASSRDTVGIFQRCVLNRATPAFQPFIRKWDITARTYAQQLRKYPAFFQSLRKATEALYQQQDSMQNQIAKFVKHYPRFQSAEICLAIGNFRTGGNIHTGTGKHYVYVGLEFHAPNETTAWDELPEFLKDYLSRANVIRTIIHELVHVQQFSHGHKVERTFSGDALYVSLMREGIADYIARAVYPLGKEGNYYHYGLMHEPVLKEQLRKALYGKEHKPWMYFVQQEVKQPHDLGYFMGARIAQAYHENLHQNKLDWTALIEVKDLKSFIHKSRYFE